MVKIMEMEIRDFAGRPWWLTDLGQRMVDERAGAELQASNLHVDLEPWGYHVFKVSIGT
jgi:hypothetical protein